jgi:hypothetical protein
MFQPGGDLVKQGALCLSGLCQDKGVLARRSCLSGWRETQSLFFQALSSTRTSAELSTFMAQARSLWG